MMDSGEEDSGETRGGGMRAPSQLTRQATPNAQPPRPPIKTRVTIDSKATKGNQARDSLSKRDSTAKNAI